MTHVTGPDFLALQVRDLDRAAASTSTNWALNALPAHHLAWWRSRPTPIPFAVREPLPGTDLDARVGVSISLRADDAQVLGRPAQRPRRAHPH
jgi:hypothetical protein